MYGFGFCENAAPATIPRKEAIAAARFIARLHSRM
jgi:hypothetical protein